MASNNLYFELNYKKIGFKIINKENPNLDDVSNYIKVLILPKNYTIEIDFNKVETKRPTLFFINANQSVQLEKLSKEDGFALFYNRDFYCVQIHDAEVACDGLLFNNLFNIPTIELEDSQAELFFQLFQNIKSEITYPEATGEELIRTYLKQMIILATRSWKKQHLSDSLNSSHKLDQEFFREFSRLVEIHYKEKHSVADYAQLLNLAPKSLNQKLKKLNVENPNELIKNRIVLEAKRLLKYTNLSVKEIGYELGYEDPAYFNRMFTQKSKYSPAIFRREEHLTEVLD
ncbi:helix-turn-helix domain-containing protein [Rhizosphaericola mali]|uniref:Helix-turn-helix domain-containing protein n=1 Tax=Rhizosphaericola mali TaxID=2545455 RepID=A0A5P2G4C5_9BACT|nr:helix-turn-helix transcriptional regulator [Rhizosphaericola mali]QES88999.1 helix-turn-helix domain-containing protein [Rhizosphaericola mali]